MSIVLLGEAEAGERGETSGDEEDDDDDDDEESDDLFSSPSTGVLFPPLLPSFRYSNRRSKLSVMTMVAFLTFLSSLNSCNSDIHSMVGSAT